MELIVLTGIVLLVVATVYSASMVTYYTIQSDYFKQSQKKGIIALAWIIPIIGPAIILAILSEDKTWKRKPGVPLLDFIFLAGVFSQDRTDQSSAEFNYDTSQHGDGDT